MALVIFTLPITVEYVCAAPVDPVKVGVEVALPPRVKSPLMRLPEAKVTVLV